MQVDDLYLCLHLTLPQVFFKHRASKNQLPGLSVNGTLVEKKVKYLESSGNT